MYSRDIQETWQHNYSLWIIIKKKHCIIIICSNVLIVNKKQFVFGIYIDERFAKINLNHPSKPLTTTYFSLVNIKNKIKQSTAVKWLIDWQWRLLDVWTDAISDHWFYFTPTTIILRLHTLVHSSSKLSSLSQ